MDFKRPERCQLQRTGREDRHSKFYEISDNLHETTCDRSIAPRSLDTMRSINPRVRSRFDLDSVVAATAGKEAPSKKLAPLPPDSSSIGGSQASNTCPFGG